MKFMRLSADHPRTKTMLLTFLILLTTTLGFDLQAANPSPQGKGFITPTQEQLDHIEQNWPRIVEVHPNKHGLARIKEHLEINGGNITDFVQAYSNIDEFVTTKGLFSSSKSNVKTATIPLPIAVDNSTLPSFPQIGNQGQEGSCVAWASTYYQATHEIGLLNGINNKTSLNRVLSPKWTYNLINEGLDDGSSFLDAFSLLSQNGAVSIVNFPYDGNYLAWDLNQQDWIAAISNRTTPPKFVSAPNNEQNLQLVKQLLNNGHILTFGTFVDSWVFTNVGSDPSQSNPYANQLAASWMNGAVGGHMITIVGYNDNVWIDVNGNGKVDPGEKGAFLIANSWGTGWGNNGFVWVSYDAFADVSVVPKGPKAGRLPIAEASNNYLFNITPKAVNYYPSLVAEFDLQQTNRDQISILGGVSNVNTTSPTKTFTSGALINQGGPYGFTGTKSTSATTASFALDMSDLLSNSNTNSNQRFYLSVSDNALGNPTILKNYALLDRVHNHQITCPNLPLVCDHSSVNPYIDYNFYQELPPDTTPPVVAITSPVDGANVTGTLAITVNATDNVAVDRVELYVDSSLYGTDPTAPYLFSVDTTKLSNGSHVLKVIAYDTSNNSAQNSLTVHVNNQTTQPIYINAGGGSVTSQGILWLADKYWSGSSSTSSANIPFANPVYQSERLGNFTYSIPVSNGQYNVTLKFAEIHFKKAKQRVFDVAINGNKVIKNLDLYKVVGYGKPYDQTYLVNATNNQIQIVFSSVVNNAKVNAIQVVPK